MLIHNQLANKAKAGLPTFLHNLHLDIYSISLTFSNIHQIQTCRLFENTRSYPSQIIHQQTSISNRQREVALFIDANSRKKGGPVIQYTSHRKKLNIHADSTKPLWLATRLPCGDLPPSALEGGAHDSGRAWSSQGLLVAGYTSAVQHTPSCKRNLSSKILHKSLPTCF